MYAPFFGLKREPFSIAPDPRFLFMSEAHREALAHLLYGVSGGGGFVLLTGEIGAGKTTVCRCFLDQVPPACDVAYVFNPKLSVPELLQTVCDEFRIELPARAASVKDYVDALNAFLLRSHAAGRHSVLIIDEAQSLSAELLEQLRLLTNLETAERKLLQIVLIGQPELRTMLARPELEQLAQRVIARYHLPALSEGETLQYVRHRLAVAGLAGEMPFDSRALRRLFQLCGGVPRRLNLLADRALLGAYAGGKTRIDRRIVDRAASEVFGPAAASPSRRPLALGLGALAAAAALALAAGLGYRWQRLPARLAAAAGPASAAQPGGTAASAASAVPVVAAGPASAALPAVAAPADASALLARSQRSEAAAWRELAPLWQLDLADGDPCEAAARAQVFCFRSNGGFGPVRELGRPGILTLRDAQDKPAYALLTGLSGDQATLSVGGTTLVLPLTVLAGLWRGDFATFWKAPPGYREPATDTVSGPLADWVGGQLPAAPGQPLRARLLAFQVAHGLKPDGVAGPMTLMQINRASGIAEPRLNPER
jgi:general secretion pathway protein A